MLSENFVVILTRAEIQIPDFLCLSLLFAFVMTRSFILNDKSWIKEPCWYFNLWSLMSINFKGILKFSTLTQYVTYTKAQREALQNTSLSCEFRVCKRNDKQCFFCKITHHNHLVQPLTMFFILPVDLEQSMNHIFKSTGSLMVFGPSCFCSSGTVEL